MRCYVFDHRQNEQTKKALSAAGYTHKQEVKGDPIEIARRLFEEGVNVLIRRIDHPTCEVMVGVDSYRFEQR